MQEPVSKLFLPKKQESEKNEDTVQKQDLNKNKSDASQNLKSDIFRMQEPVSKDILAKKEDVVQFREVIQEKDVLIKNNVAKIKELEAEIKDLRQKNQGLETKLKASLLDDNGFEEVMLNYDEFFKKVWTEREQLLNKNAVIETYLENLECSYYELLEKFQKSKEVICGLKNNQDMLKEELAEYKDIIDCWEKRYDDLKEHSETTIAVANMEIGTKEKKIRKK